jgi:hypothetical protein
VGSSLGFCMHGFVGPLRVSVMFLACKTMQVLKTLFLCVFPFGFGGRFGFLMWWNRPDYSSLSAQVSPWGNNTLKLDLVR